MVTPVKVLYFIAGVRPTVDEAAAMAAMEADVKVGVRQSNNVTSLYGVNTEPCDFVAGTVPAAYSALPVYTGGGGGPDLGGDLAGIPVNDIANALNLRRVFVDAVQYTRGTPDGHIRQAN